MKIKTTVLPLARVRSVSALLVCILAGMFFGCDDSEPEDVQNLDLGPPCANCKKVLLVGSSYLGFNAMPRTFLNLCEAAGLNIYVDTSLVFGTLLSFHCTHPETLERIASEDWDFVVLQDSGHTISDPQWHHLIIPYVARMDEIIKEHSSTTSTVFMMPWGYEDGLVWMNGEDATYLELQQSIRDQSLVMCHDLDLGLAPVGWAWRQVIMEHPEIVLFLDDRSHPNRQGSYLTACVLCVSLFGQRLENVPFYGELEPAEAELLQRVASDVVLRDWDQWNLPEDNPDTMPKGQK